MIHKNILVLCTGNSCRSQMAEGYLRNYGPGCIKVYSAGIETHGVNPVAIEIMKEDGIDISRHTSNNVNEYKNIDFDSILTVCDHAREQCPVISSRAKRIHHSFEDPSKTKGSREEILNNFRTVREEIKKYCADFVKINFEDDELI